MRPRAGLVDHTERRLARWNTARSIVVLVIIGGSIAACGGLLGGQVGFLVGMGLGATIASGSWWLSDRAVLRASRSSPIDGTPTDGLRSMLADLSLRAGIPTPRFYVTQNAQPNAFAVGRNPSRAAIVVTEGLLSLLEPAEIRAVLARELVQIRRGDTVMTSMVGAALSVVFAAIELAWRDAPTRRYDTRSAFELAFSQGRPVAIRPLRRARKSRREMEADRGGSDLAGNPEALARALARIDRYAQVVPMGRRLAHVSNWVVNPLGDRRDGTRLVSRKTSLAERINLLRSAQPERAAP
jgi:heat shock protein HtpX